MSAEKRNPPGVAGSGKTQSKAGGLRGSLYGIAGELWPYAFGVALGALILILAHWWAR